MGKITGVCTQVGAGISLAWDEDKLCATIDARDDISFKLYSYTYPKLTTKKESIKENGNCFTLALSKGESITLEFTK